MGALAVLALSACATAGARPPAGDARAPVPYTPADARFMGDMIHHHAQAVLMAEWAPTHGASETIRTWSERMLVSQRDEIVFMQRWLRERGEPVPEADPSHAMMEHGTHHAPGMLAAEQLAAIDRSRGAEFDRLFLACMIQHHEGALAMVEELFRAPGAAQDEDVFRFASDVHADQIAEIERMAMMLENLPNGGMECAT